MDYNRILLAKEPEYKISALEEKEMGALSKNLDSKVDTVIGKIAKNYKLKGVFEKRSKLKKGFLVWYDF